MLLLALACAPSAHTSLAAGNGPGENGGTEDSGGEESGDTDAPLACDDVLVACVSEFPYSYQADTREGVSAIDAYACSPDTDESGPELAWRVDISEAGFLSATIQDDADAGIDIDLHLLSRLDGERCIDRGNFDVGADVEPGSYFLVADSYVAGGTPQSGKFSLDVDFLVPQTGDCAVKSGSIRRVGDNGDALAMPATGPVVLEAHLVATDDGYGTESTDEWPQSSHEGLSDHYVRGGTATRIAMHREQNWAPQENCEFGQSANGDKLPREDEGWYVNMYWSDRPAGGTRMILRTADGRAVVASAGWETGPGDLEHIAGTSEEAHFYLGTGHLSEMTVGFAEDASLALGPIRCESSR